MTELNRLVANLFDYDKASAEAAKVYQEAHVATCRKFLGTKDGQQWAKYKIQPPENPNDVSFKMFDYDTMSAADRRVIDDKITDLRFRQEEMRGYGLDNEMHAVNEASDHLTKSSRLRHKAKKKLAGYLGVDHVELVTPGSTDSAIRMVVNKGAIPITFAKADFTTEILRHTLNTGDEAGIYVVRKHSPIWKEAAPRIEERTSTRAGDHETPFDGIVEPLKRPAPGEPPKIEEKTVIGTGADTSLDGVIEPVKSPPPGEPPKGFVDRTVSGAAKAEETAGSWLERVWGKPEGKWGIIGGAAAVVGVGYWVLKSKQKKNETQQDSQTTR